MKKNIILLLLCFLFVSNVHAGTNIGGGGEYNGSDCSSSSSVCYSTLLQGETVQGIRITMVDKYGNKIAGTNSVDYVNSEAHKNALYNKTYYTYYAVKRHKNDRLKYQDDILYNRISVIFDPQLALPDFIDKGKNSIMLNYFSDIESFDKTSDDPGIKVFYDACGYKWKENTDNGKIKDHYLLIEPLTYVRVTDKINERTVHYFGTVTDIAKMMKTHGYVLWSGFFGTMLPLSIYVRDGQNGAKQTAGLTSIQTWVDTGSVKDFSAEILTSNGTAAGHIWADDLPKYKPDCDYYDPNDFPKTRNDPDRKCCTDVLNNPSKYGVTRAQILAKYPQCDQTQSNDPKPPCTFDLSIKIPNDCDVSTEGYIKDIDNWSCIFSSRNSSNNDVKTNFFSWENRYCSYFCREEISYQFPNNSLEVLAGNRFTLGDNGFFPNLAPIHFIGRSECRPTSTTGSIRWDLFETDWEAANNDVKDKWDNYQISLKRDYAANTATKERKQECGCVYNTSHNSCCTSERAEYHSRTCSRSCNCSTTNGVRTCSTCSYDCSYYTYPCTSPNNTYHYKYFPSTVYYDSGSGNQNVTPSSYCSRPDYGTSTNRTLYNNAVQTRANYESAIKQCNDWERSYDEFDPNTKFKYEEATYGGNVYTLTKALEKRTQTNYFINNDPNATINNYKRTGTTYKYVCNTTGLTCKKGSSVSGSTYVYPKNDWLRQFTTKEYEYSLPAGVYNYIQKPLGESYNYNPGGNYYNLGYSSLPVHYSRQTGYYDLELDYDTFGNNHKFNKFIFENGIINVDYGGNTELSKFISDNNLMQYISLCANNSANCSYLNYNFYVKLANGGQLNNFLNSDCAQNSYCRVSGSYITCGVPHVYTYQGTYPPYSRMYISGNWYWYYGIPLEVWNSGYTWWVKNGGAWDFLSRPNSHDRYYPNGDYYDKYICYSIEYGGQCTYQGTFYAPTGTLLDGKESPSNFGGDNVYAKLQKCLLGNNNGSTPADAFNGRTKYECQYRVINQIVCPAGTECDYIGLSVVFRPILLTDPFPGLNGTGRTPGTNWRASSTINTYIANNRGVTADRVYYDRGPLYKITLTPSIIKSIRDYNKKQTQLDNGYADFSMNCLNNGTKCLSNFIRNSSYANLFSGCGIAGKNSGNKPCGINEAW